MALDPATAEAFAKWQKEKGINLTCAACGGTDWALQDRLGLPIFVGPRVPFNGEVAAFQPMTCKHCGYVAMFFVSPASDATGA